MAGTVVHYHAATTANEHWFIVHSRKLFVHTFHNHTICLSSDGRLAIATGPFMMVLHPPAVPPFRPTLTPPLRLIFSVQNEDKVGATARKDTMITATHLTAVSWIHHCLLLLNGRSSLTFLSPPTHAANFADVVNNKEAKTPASWIPDAYSLPKQHLKPPLKELSLNGASDENAPDLDKMECFAYTRLRNVDDAQVDNVTFFPFLAYADNKSAQIIPVSSKHSLLPHNTNLVIAPFCIHDSPTTAIACIEGVQTDSGLATIVAVADAALFIVVYALKLNFDMEGPYISSQNVWSSLDSIPPGPVVSLSWSLPGTRESLLTLAIAKGNDVFILDWVSQTANALTMDVWSRPLVHYIHDAHEHIVTGVQICHDGSIISSGMDGLTICWRISPIQDESVIASGECAITANILQEVSDAKEPVLALERSANAFAFVGLSSTTRQGQEVSDVEVMRKSSGSQRRTIIRIFAIPPYGTPDNVENAIISCVERLMNHPSLLEKPLTFWDVSHFLHSFHECSTAVVPKLRERLVDMVEEHENRTEKSTQKFAQRCRVLLWFAKIIDHPDGVIVDHECHDIVKDLSRRLRNSLLFMQYVNCLQQFLAIANPSLKRTSLERLALENMCQFVSTWRVVGVDLLQTGLHAVREVRKWMQSFMQDGETLSSNCPVCSSNGSETLLVADGVDPSSVWCIPGHVFPRCVISALPVVDAVSMECAACGARAFNLPEEGFNWIDQVGQCALCNGGVVSAQCEAG